MWLWIMVLGVIVAWAVTPLIVPIVMVHASGVSNAGEFGDLFGAATSLFSGLAFAGLFWALRLQTQQLELQRQELSLQREEMRLQRLEMSASRAELANQVATQKTLFYASAAQVEVAAFQADLQALHWRAYNLNANNSARAQLEIPAKEIAERLRMAHQKLLEEHGNGPRGNGVETKG